jgi:DNA helicase-2/ATP-dependent DNA helicase PcrA
VGLEEGLFPHFGASNEEAELEEERRLCYVGITRAREFLHMTCAKSRYLWGTFRMMKPSRFFGELPKECYERVFGKF